MKNTKIPIRIKFLIFMIILYFITFLFDKDYAIQVLENFLDLSLKIFPIIIIVFIVMFLTNIFLSDKIIKKHLGSDSKMKGWFWSILTGILIPSPPYVVFPLLGDLQKKGMRKALIVCFLYARNLQITFLPVMAFYFGLQFTIIISIYILIFSILSGIFIEKIID